MDAQLSRSFLGALLAGRPESPPADTLRQLRSQALERANALSVPTVRDEAWRFTDLTPLYRATFTASPSRTAVDPQRVAPFRCAETALCLVFVDGEYRPGLSASDPPEGITLAVAGGHAAAPAAAAFEPWLGRLASFEDDPFVAVNTARLDGAICLRVARGCRIATPVHCLFVTATPGVATHPRLLVRAEDGSEVVVVEDHVALVADGAYCVNAVTEISVGDNASVHHVRVQREHRSAFHVGTTAVHVGRDGRFTSDAVAFGARISRHNLNVVQDGPGTSFDLRGLAWIGGRQLADTHSFADHASPHGTSRQVHKCVVDGAAHAVFNGRILVRPGAQQTDSAQESRNLLLSEKAHVDTKPQLEIFADDVKCAHGATVGQLEAEEVFYLRSRGLDEARARNLLTFGFAADVINRIPVASLARSLRAFVLEQTGVQEIA